MPGRGRSDDVEIRLKRNCLEAINIGTEERAGSRQVGGLAVESTTEGH